MYLCVPVWIMLCSVVTRVDPEVEEEYSRHREFLSRSVKQMQQTLESSSLDHMETNSSVMKTNLGLIAEINKQREANRQLKLHVSDFCCAQKHQIVTSKYMQTQIA